MLSDSDKQNWRRFRVQIGGVVQGVGFRPFIFSAAKKCDLSGFVNNTGDGVVVEVEGAAQNLNEFEKILRENPPPLSHITKIEFLEIEKQFSTDFYIAASEKQTARRTFVSPDVSVCEDCLREMFDENDRRFRYPFINCTNCGPRFTITKNIPYDRPQTTMSVFEMCEKCGNEYENPLDRRFHAQPNACAECGPKVWFSDKNNREIFGEEAISATRKILADGKIIAVKGIGGFHLVCDARNDNALRILRERKGRIDKPFAVMCRNLETANESAQISELEKKILTGRERPIVLLEKKPNGLSELIAPGNNFLGVMLPYSPLHYLLFDENLDVLVMTSGNYSNEPIITNNDEALEKLSILADAFLLHDRDIFVPCDDSVIRIVQSPKSKVQSLKSKLEIRNQKSEIENVLPIRRSRGYAPFPVELPFEIPPVLAVGGELKAAFCLAQNEYTVMSQHLGDMENLETLGAFEKSVEQMRKLFRVEPEIVAFDKHPNYLSSRWAKEKAARIFQREIKLVAVQHHHAHIASVLAENNFDGAGKVIGFAFDGTGYGDDGAIWGGEVLLADYRSFERAAHLQYFPLAGGDASVKKPYRTALGFLWKTGINWSDQLPSVAACSATERKILLKQFENNFNVVQSSSFGRLFDAVAAIGGVRQTVTYEAQAAIEFEALMDKNISDAYEFDLIDGQQILIDYAKLFEEATRDVLLNVSISAISAKFNNAAANLILRLALKFRERDKINRVALSGGCFQNAALLEASLRRLRENDFEVFTHHLVPPNDGGLALGQAVIAGFNNTVSNN